MNSPVATPSQVATLYLEALNAVKEGYMEACITYMKLQGSGHMNSAPSVSQFY